MSVFNGEKYLNEAIESILNQYFSDFEFLIINDASTDSSQDIILSYKDSRIKFINNDQNIGLSKSLNKGIAIAQANFIARMDCDDISLPKRLEKQYDFMVKNPEIGVLGCNMELFGDKTRTLEYPTDFENIKITMLFSNSLSHPSVILRKQFFYKYKLLYNPEFKTSQDYELWIKCLEHFQLANIPEILLKYRTHPTQISEKEIDFQSNNAIKVKLYQMKKLGIEPDIEEITIHEALSAERNLNIENFSERAKKWLTKLKQANEIQEIYDKNLFEKALNKKLACFCPAEFLNIYRNKIENFISENQGKRICFWGAGKLGEEFLKLYNTEGLNILGFIDTSPEKVGKLIMGHKIYLPKALSNLNPEILAFTVLRPQPVAAIKIKESESLNFKIWEDFFQ
jgi:glycosyltransferase involved in cell wall biosynthesis